MKVFVALDRAPLMTAAAGTFVDELVTLAGGLNVASSSPIKYPVFSIEQLLAADPAVILDAAEVRPIQPRGGGRALAGDPRRRRLDRGEEWGTSTRS